MPPRGTCFRAGWAIFLPPSCPLLTFVPGTQNYQSFLNSSLTTQVAEPRSVHRVLGWDQPAPSLCLSYKSISRNMGPGEERPGWTTLYTPPLRCPIPSGTIQSHSTVNLSLWEVTLEGSHELFRYMHFSLLEKKNKPNYKEQGEKDRCGREEPQVHLSSTCIAMRQRRAGQSVVLQGEHSGPAQKMSHINSSSPSLILQLLYATQGCSSPHPLLPSTLL